jgi:hypothetical protein
MITCPNCGRENDAEAKICAYCGAPLFDAAQAASTRTLEDTDTDEDSPFRHGKAQFTERTNLILGVDGEIRSLTFDANEIEELVIGREDPKTGEAPEVNLTPYAALDKGVSRRHAAITRHNGWLYVVDMGSANGTFLNGQRLVPNQPRMLRDGDDIRVGLLVVRVTFERA